VTHERGHRAVSLPDPGLAGRHPDHGHRGAGWAHVSAIIDSEMKIQVQIDSDLKDNLKDHEQRLKATR
jgi:hypothetical protein